MKDVFKVNDLNNCYSIEGVKVWCDVDYQLLSVVILILRDALYVMKMKMKIRISLYELIKSNTHCSYNKRREKGVF